MEIKADLKYTAEHEWMSVEGDLVRIGITDFAQSELGDIVYVDLPAIGKKLQAGDTLAVVESTKAASDVYSPLSGVVVEVNAALAASPDAINREPYAAGWLAVVKPDDLSSYEEAMSADAYEAILQK